MAIAIEMPKMTDTMEEGVLVEWLVEEGSKIAAGDIIAQVETDKATMDVEAYDDGVLLKRVAKEGDALPIGGLIGVLGTEGEDVTDVLAAYSNGLPDAPASTREEPSASDANQSTSEAAQAGSTAAASPEQVTVPTGRIKASPLAKRMAADHGLNLTRIPGSGPEGRIIKRDIEAEVQRAPIAVRDRSYSSVRITQMRKAIARRLAQSKYTAPHFYLNVDVAMERCVMARSELNERAERTGGVKLSFNDFVTKACAISLAEHPDVNVSYHAEEGEIRQFRYVDIGIAVAIDDGLVTPVVRDADQKGLVQIALETRALAERARSRELLPEDMEGSTFTTSNLGMFGIESFTAIINPPNSCILAIGAIRDVPVVEDGMIVPGKRMMLTLSCDHRAVDGAVGARFLSAVQGYLEAPFTLMV